MADQSDFLANLAQQLAYYQGGGKDPGMRDVDKAGTIGDTITNSVKNVLAIKQAKLANQKTQLGLTPFGQYVGAPTSSQIDQAKQNDVTAQDTFTADKQQALSGLPQQEQSNLSPEELQAKGWAAPTPTAPALQQKYDAVKQTYGVTPETPWDVAEKAIPINQNIQYKNALIQNLTSGYYQNPLDPSDISATPVPGYIKVKGKDAMANDLKAQAQQNLLDINQAKNDLANARNQWQSEQAKQMIELKTQQNEILKERIAAMEAKTVQAASTGASKDASNHWFQRMLGVNPNPSTYLDSAAPSQSNNSMPTATDANGKKVGWNGKAWVSQ